MILRPVVVSLVAALLGFPSAPAHAGSGCVTAGWDGASATCTWSYADYVQSSSARDGRTWRLSIQSDNGGIRRDDLLCSEGDESGIWHDVFLDGADVGDVCVPDSALGEVDIAQAAIRQFKRIAWPSSHLVVQPVGGKTLVNLATNFYTLDHRPIDQTVIVAGRSVDIRASPVLYGFYFGDGAVERTTRPGRAYPDLDVTHEYERTGSVVVRLDTTYAGEYRIDDAAWVSIPDTLTVQGATQDLEVLEARPQLVLQ